MGIDPAAVVDPRLRVIGVDNLRVVGSSIIPQVPSANLSAISMAIGEKGSDMILEDIRQAARTKAFALSRRGQFGPALDRLVVPHRPNWNE
ncbi:GMC oxidoreductase [Sinorhizobium americanum]|uniref:GMC oxidoreductase n=1 Tax=Sinorhizobium americanum TaxID=194963 RepID=UPI0005667DBE|nr:GMC oxidoreductase [Sinorhizobium americanum]